MDVKSEQKRSMDEERERQYLDRAHLRPIASEREAKREIARILRAIERAG